MPGLDGEAILEALEAQRRELLAELRERRKRTPAERRSEATARMSSGYAGSDGWEQRRKRRAMEGEFDPHRRKGGDGGEE